MSCRERLPPCPAGAKLQRVSPASSPAAVAVENRLFAALAVLRIVVLLNAVALSVYRADDFQRPSVGAACVIVMIVWTGLATWTYREPRRRTHLLLATDLALAVALLLLTPLAKGADFTASVPGFWIIGALIAWSIHYRWTGGLIAGLLLAAADLFQRHDLGQADYGNAFLLVIGGPTIGFMSESLQRMATERDEAERSAAMAAERARLARAVHDGVLQVLALVQRRGLELGGEAAELGRLAGEQERELRGLIRAQETVDPIHPADTVDPAAELARLERHHAVTVSTPGTRVELPAVTGHELVAAARACLDNVRLHVGADAPAWVLLQAFPTASNCRCATTAPASRPAGSRRPPRRADSASSSRSVAGSPSSAAPPSW